MPDRFATAQTGAEEAIELASWWRRFNDPLLDQLVADASAGNFDVAAAVARLRQAREALIQAGADRLPTVSGSAGATRSFTRGQATALVLPDPTGTGAGQTITTGGNSGTTRFSLGIDASWQADIFGGVSRAIEAARADRAASAFDLAAVRTALSGEVATNYLDVRLAQARLAIARDTLRAQEDNLEIAGWRVQAGLVSAIDQEQARAQRAQTAATIPALERDFASAANRLAVLTGRAPGSLRGQLEASAPIPRGPEAIAIGIPADTLRRRPDVRTAERQLAAATARIGVAQAQLYPALAITGNVATDAGRLASLFNTSSGGLFAGLTQLIFDGGRLRSQVRGQRAAADAAYANYRQTILNGLEDAENGLQALETAKARQVQFVEAADAANNAAIYARSQYRAGLTDFQTVLESERSLLSARDSLAVSQADQALSLVQLFLALGGGWNPDDNLDQTGSPE